LPMSNNKKKKLTPTQQEYQQLAKKLEPKRPVLTNCLRAFLVGGLICLIGQAIQMSFVEWGGFDKKEAGNPTVAILIFISVVLTGLGVYDKIAQWAGAGSAVPVTGFANSMASAAIEHRCEGLVLGVGGKMFKLAGPVIVFGVVAAFLVGIVHLIFHPELAVGGGK
jgi:stage V sporulation protein AC